MKAPKKSKKIPVSRMKISGRNNLKLCENKSKKAIINNKH